MRRYKGWWILTHKQEDDGRWFGTVTKKDCTGKKLSTSYAFTAPNNTTKHEAINRCKNYIDSELNIKLN